MLASGLAKVPCSWIDVESFEGGNGAPVAVNLKGVSGQSTQAIAQIEQMLKGASIGGLSMNYADIAPVPSSFCGPIAAFAQFKSVGVAHLSVPQTKFEMAPLTGNIKKEYLGQLGTNAIIEIDLQGITGQTALVAIGETGEMQLLSVDMKKLDFLKPTGNLRYRLTLPTTNAGWNGIMLIDGKGPFNRPLFDHSAGSLGQDWPQKFTAAAKAQSWKTEMVWFQSVNDQPDALPSK